MNSILWKLFILLHKSQKILPNKISRCVSFKKNMRVKKKSECFIDILWMIFIILKSYEISFMQVQPHHPLKFMDAHSFMESR
jgi:hypothetical protein